MAKTKRTRKPSAASRSMGIYARQGDTPQPIFTIKALEFLGQVMVNVWEFHRLDNLAGNPEIQTNRDAVEYTVGFIEKFPELDLPDEATAPMKARAKEIAKAHELLNMAVEEHGAEAVLAYLTEAVPLNLARAARTN